MPATSMSVGMSLGKIAVSLGRPAQAQYQPLHPGLMTDMYHPDSAYVAWVQGRNDLVTFDLYARRAPFDGAYLLFAGLETALHFVRDFRFTDEDVRFLAQIRDYDRGYLEELRNFRFSGEILAMPEGSIAFPNEPLLRVTGPFREALLLESGLLNSINLATLIATKAARIVQAASGRRVTEFALRRAQEPFVVTRSAYIGGMASTSFVAAAFEYRLQATGTIPHALIQLFEDERAAFAAVAASFNRYTLLLDTYDPRRAIHTAVDVASEYHDRLGHTLAAVRLDFGDLEADARYVRDVLDRAGLTTTRIFVSGDLDEYSIADLVARGAPIDGFGVGTRIGVGAGSVEHGVSGGALGGVYKLVNVETAGVSAPRIKTAGDKTTWPGKKEVYRFGTFERDLIALDSEPKPLASQRLLRPVVRDGELLAGSLPPLSEIWEFAQQNLRDLPDQYHALTRPPAYPVEFSASLRQLRDDTIAHYGGDGPTDREEG
ncbi:MAG: nicotinate phosphoribosyltransferase [Chloroflexota bacterium]|nr:MAG: nicotinate phosphoribosyltransferase [Chloroflexota bacterium]